MKVVTSLLALALCTVSIPVHADAPDLRVAPLEHEIESRVHASSAAIQRCHARSTPAMRRALARVQRVLLPIGFGNDVSDLVFEPAVPVLAPLRACLLPVVRSWQLSRPETHEPAIIVVEGEDLAQMFRRR